MMDNSPGMGPLLSWGLFAAGAAAAGYYYTQTGKTPDTRRKSVQRTAPVEPTKKEKEKPKKKAPSKQKPVANEPAPIAVTTADSSSDKKRKEGDADDDDYDVSTKMFAQRMAQAREGAKIGGGKKDDSRIKTVRSSKAETKPAGVINEAPVGEPVDNAATAAAGDVSDMLEPAAPAPTTLRVTGDTEQKKKPKKQAKEEEVETKKQRQNRQRVEAKRIEREEGEKERKALEERQRRAAPLQ
ncbi:hypothetical protein MBLNU230_g1167t2 [Neophaeotheca triangularis]